MVYLVVETELDTMEGSLAIRNQDVATSIGHLARKDENVHEHAPWYPAALRGFASTTGYQPHIGPRRTLENSDACAGDRKRTFRSDVV